MSTRDRHFGIGILGGLALAIFYVVIAVAIDLLATGTFEEEYGFSLLVLSQLYLGGGMVGGGLVGFLWPLTVSRIGSVVVGILGAIPMTLGAALLVGEPGDLESSVFAGLIVGFVLGGWVRILLLFAPELDFFHQCIWRLGHRTNGVRTGGRSVGNFGGFGAH